MAQAQKVIELARARLHAEIDRSIMLEAELEEMRVTLQQLQASLDLGKRLAEDVCAGQTEVSLDELRRWATNHNVGS
jgi:hypothetical protein